jgi:NhaA family Na+:H+ antiporter
VKSARALDSKTPIERFVRPFQEFAKLQSSGGVILIGCIVVALVWANSPWAASYFHLWHTNLTFGFAGSALSESLHFWINDGLMAVFFLLVGLEIKRESLVGELASFQRAALPIAAALGGMLVPVGFYLLFNHGSDGAAGWSVPMATDIAFALGVLALLGNRVPASLRIFLAAFAIADDIGAVLVIALFYAETISGIHLAVAGICFAALITLNRAGARHPIWYAILGTALWIAFLKSGIHATVAGVLLAMTIPARQRIDSRAFLARSEGILTEFRDANAAGERMLTSARKSAALHALARDCERVESPMMRFEHALGPWVNYVIMPVFALANAGVALETGASNALVGPVGIGILCGLVFGKPIGITFFSWLTTQLGFAALPTGISWRHILGAGALGGIGFTMSIFIANLAFGSAPLLETAKVAILAASLLSGIGGAIILLKKSQIRKGAISHDDRTYSAKGIGL